MAHVDIKKLVKDSTAIAVGPFDEILNSGSDYLWLFNNGLQGTFFEDGTTISCSYEKIGPWHDGTSFAKKDGTWVLLDKKEQVLKSFDIPQASPCLSVLVIEQDGKTGAMNKDGEMAIPTVYQSIELLSDKYEILVLRTFDDHTQLADRWGRVVTTRLYGPYIGTSSPYMWWYHNDPFGGLINLNDEQYKSIVMFDCERLKELNAYEPGQSVSNLLDVFRRDSRSFIAYKDGKTQLIDRDGRIVVPYDKGYQDFGPFPYDCEDYLIPALKDGKWGYVSDCGVEKIKCSYDIAEAFCKGLAVAGYIDNNTRQIRIGLIDRHGRVAVPFDFVEISSWGTKDGVLFVMGQKEPDTRCAVYSPDGRFELLQGGKSFMLDGVPHVISCKAVMTAEEYAAQLKYVDDGHTWWYAKKSGDKFGLYDVQGRAVIRPVFNGFSSEFNDRGCIAWTDDAVYVIYSRDRTVRFDPSGSNR